MRQEEAPSTGRTPHKEAPKSALKSPWDWAPQARSARLCFMTPVRDWSQQYPDLGGYTLPKASVILVYTTRLLYDPGFFLQACKIETAYPSPFSGPVTIS